MLGAKGVKERANEEDQDDDADDFECFAGRGPRDFVRQVGGGFRAAFVAARQHEFLPLNGVLSFPLAVGLSLSLASHAGEDLTESKAGEKPDLES